MEENVNINNIKEKVKELEIEITNKMQDYEDICKRIEHSVWWLKRDTYELMSGTLQEFNEISKILETMVKELKKLNGEEILDDDDLPF